MPTWEVDDESFKNDAEGEAPHSLEEVGDAKGQEEAAVPDGQAEADAQDPIKVATSDGLCAPEGQPAAAANGTPQKAGGRWWQCFSSRAPEPIPSELPVEAPVEAPAEATDNKETTPAKRAQTMPNMKHLASPAPAAGTEDQKVNNEDPLADVAEDAPPTVAVEDELPADVVDEQVAAEETAPAKAPGSKRGSAQELQDKLAKQLQKEEAGISAVDHIGPKEGAVTKVHSELRHKLVKQAKKAETGEAAGIDEAVDENADAEDVPTLEGAGLEGVQALTGQA